MNFIKNYSVGRGGSHCELGSVIIRDGTIRLRIRQENATLKEFGIVDGGIGAIISLNEKGRQKKAITKVVPYSPKDIPIELQGKGYCFKISPKKLSDTEYIFLFKDAKMKNHK